MRNVHSYTITTISGGWLLRIEWDDMSVETYPFKPDDFSEIIKVIVDWDEKTGGGMFLNPYRGHKDLKADIE
jgi:hypothetical protein